MGPGKDLVPGDLSQFNSRVSASTPEPTGGGAGGDGGVGGVTYRAWGHWQLEISVA